MPWGTRRLPTAAANAALHCYANLAKKISEFSEFSFQRIRRIQQTLFFVYEQTPFSPCHCFSIVITVLAWIGSPNNGSCGDWMNRGGDVRVAGACVGDTAIRKANFGVLFSFLQFGMLRVDLTRAPGCRKQDLGRIGIGLHSCPHRYYVLALTHSCTW